MTASPALSVGIAGCSGRMGLTLVQAALAKGGVTLAAGSERPGFDENAVAAKLATVGAKHVFVTSDVTHFAGAVDAVIDFTAPEASLANAKAVAAKGGVHIVGTTGFSPAQQKELESYANQARIVQSGNFSLGVNVLQNLVEQAARLLNEGYDIEIFEAHHRHKKDAPSGTALMLGHAAAKGRGVSLDAKKVAVRDGMTGERKDGDIGFSVFRGGDIVGLHEVMLAGPGEMITLKHQGFDRSIYANGAMAAALWAAKQKPGLYSMKDVLGL
ncbi:MAG: 4-hydroxy-tetrahydrodipicolinate reductase [Rickettsiales bacterium]|nr:4-hydroxy-tetrahydrodipicolinate reductase [Rickettsiales bacterium]